MIAFPNAKINIGLNVVSKRSDGYHNLETVFYPVRLSDALEIVPSGKFGYSASGLEIDGDPENNLVVKAFRLLEHDFDISPVKIHLHKIIPFGAGLGGGSSDGAFALKMLNNYFSLDLDNQTLRMYAARLGADSPFFIDNQPAFASGIGDQLEPIDIDLSAYQIVIVKPDFSVSTVEAYRNIAPHKPEFNLKKIVGLPVENWKDAVKNDFEESVFPYYPKIREIKEKLYELGASYASMSGSGSAVFGIFRHLPMNLDNSLPKGIFIYR